MQACMSFFSPLLIHAEIAEIASNIWEPTGFSDVSRTL